MDIYKIYYLADLVVNSASSPSRSFCRVSLQREDEKAKKEANEKNAAKLLLLAKRVWKIKLAFASLARSLSSKHAKCLYELCRSSFSSGFSFYGSPTSSHSELVFRFLKMGGREGCAA